MEDLQLTISHSALVPVQVSIFSKSLILILNRDFLSAARPDKAAPKEEEEPES